MKVELLKDLVPSSFSGKDFCGFWSVPKGTVVDLFCNVNSENLDRMMTEGAFRPVLEDQQP